MLAKRNRVPLLLFGGGAAVSSALGQFVAPPTTLKEVMGHAGVAVRYKAVPAGICEQNPDVKSFSGYADVSEDEHIFWWFFEARNEDPAEAPLTVWINGGPGSSSMIGLFEELGPCGVDYFGNVYNNPYSWTNASNMLFIDQPSQVGFSYSKPVRAWSSGGDIIVLPDDVTTCPEYAPPGSCGTYAYPNLTLTANSTAAAAPNFWKTLQGFMGAFPHYSRGGFHFATESYGGHYGPVFNSYIEQQNARNITGAVPIQLETVLIGNGWYDPYVQYQAYYNFSVSPGNTYDYAPFNASVATMFYNNLYGPGNCLDRLDHCRATGEDAVCRHADTFCADQVESVYDNVLGRDEYDVRELTPDPFPYGFYRDYLNTADVQAAIGAFTNFSSNGAVSEAFGNTGDDGRESGTIEALRYLLDQGVSVALYAGDADYNCNWLGNEVVAGLVGASGFSEAGYADLATNDGVVHGQVKQAGRFSFTRIYESGHEVPFYQPLVSLEYFDRAIRGRDLQTGTRAIDDAYRTAGPSRSTYREGNGTVQLDVTPENRTYDVETNKPGPPWQKTLIKRGFRSPPRRRLGRFRR